MPIVWGPYKIITVCDKILKVLKAVIENPFSSYRVTNASGPQEGPQTNGDSHNTKKVSRTWENWLDHKESH